MEKFRLIVDKIIEPAKHYALEEAMMRLMDESENFPNTLRLRRVKKSVLVGIFENPYDTVNVDFAKKYRVKIVRRHNAGGTVYQDLGSFMFTCLYKDGRFISNLCEEETYEEFSDLIIRFLKKFGIDGKRRGLNDVTVNDKKIFGSSFTKIGDAISFTGTILVNMDLDFLSKVLKFVKPKFSDKKFKNLKDGLTTISIELNKKIKIKYVYDKFIETFKEKFGVELMKEKLTKEEVNLMKMLCLEKYNTRDWTFGENKEFEEIYTKKIKSGLLIIRGNFQDRINDIKIYGDFLISDKDKVFFIENNLKDKTINEGVKLIQESEISEDLKNGIINLLDEIKKRGRKNPPS
ncbi:MAG: lipoate--protein ligase family protein [Caldisericia bacterium]